MHAETSKHGYYQGKDFYQHQKKYLEPAIVSVWRNKQSKLLTDCTSRDLLQLVVMAEQIALGILPSTGLMEYRPWN